MATIKSILEDIFPDMRPGLTTACELKPRHFYRFDKLDHQYNRVIPSLRAYLYKKPLTHDDVLYQHSESGSGEAASVINLADKIIYVISVDRVPVRQMAILHLIADDQSGWVTIHNRYRFREVVEGDEEEEDRSI